VLRNLVVLPQFGAFCNYRSSGIAWRVIYRCAEGSALTEHQLAYAPTH
jgi:hypothetical protein